jgi:hypothetical protein
VKFAIYLHLAPRSNWLVNYLTRSPVMSVVVAITLKKILEGSYVRWTEKD